MKHPTKAVRKRQPRKRKQFPNRAVRKRNPRSLTSGHTGTCNSEAQETGVAIPPFSLSARVREEDSSIDKLEISARHGRVIGNSEEIDLFMKFAGAAPCEDRSESVSKLYGRIFSVTPYNGMKTYPLSVRKTPMQWGGITLQAPPFSGKLRTRRSSEGGNTVCQLFTDLHLNPSKALNLRPSIARKGCSLKTKKLFKQRDSVDLLSGLDGKANVVPPDLSIAERRRGTKNYLRSVYSCLYRELYRASRAIDGEPMLGTITAEDFSIGMIETYWEFSVSDATALLDRIKTTLISFHKENRVREHGERKHGSDCGVEGNAKTVTLYMGKGESLRIYAKTTDRIRFEVIHKPKAQHGILTDGYVAASLEDLTTKLKQAGQRAANLVNRVMRFLSEWATETPQERAKSTRYSSWWFMEMGHSEPAIQLLEILQGNGKVNGGSFLNEDLQKQLRKAKRLELVFTDENSKATHPRSPPNSTTLPFV